MISEQIKKELKKLGYNEKEIVLYNRKLTRSINKNFKESVEYLAKEYIKK